MRVPRRWAQRRDAAAAGGGVRFCILERRAARGAGTWSEPMGMLDRAAGFDQRRSPDAAVSALDVRATTDAARDAMRRTTCAWNWQLNLMLRDAV